MKIRGVAIEDTFAEAFTMRVARIIITGSGDTMTNYLAGTL